MRHLVPLLALLLAADPARAAEPPTEAQAEARAEAQRLREEMRDRAARGQWAGVDRAWRALAALDGVALRYEDHELGAQAAEALGHPADARDRIEAALAIEPREEGYAWKARFLAEYGEAKLVVGARCRARGEGVLVALDPPLEPAPRNAIAAAARALAAEGRFEGLLPLGMYRLCDRPFEIVGGPRVDVRAERPGG